MQLRTNPWAVSLIASSLILLSAACGDDDTDDPGDAGSSGTSGETGGGGKSGSGGRSSGGASGRSAGGAGANAEGGQGGSTSGGQGGSGARGGSTGNGTSGTGTSGGTGGAGSGSTAAGSGGSSAGTGGSSSLDDAGVDDDAGPASPLMSFFVSSTTHSSGSLGGLAAADTLCQSLASSVGRGSKTWHAYLSSGTQGSPSHARDRIGTGPWYNADGVVLAQDLSALHARLGDANVFLDELGRKINGNWSGSPIPVQHDILTGSDQQGQLLPDNTCDSWTSNSASLSAQVGHSDGLGPNGQTSGTFTSWNAAHLNMDCSDTAPRGGAGKIYCFAIN